MDGSYYRQLARFWAATDALDTRAGIFGMVRDGGTGHKAVLAMTMDMYRDMCTPLMGAPNVADDRAKMLNKDLFDHILDTTEVWNTDAGSDEVLAGKEAKLHGPSAADVAPMLPGLKVINRDRAHACRRVVKRPWTTDDYLKSVHDHLVLSKTSMCRAIQYSPLAIVGIAPGQEDVDHIISKQQDMSLALHRFESSSKPLSIVCLTFPAVNMTAVKVFAQRRCNGPGKHALAHLEFINGAKGIEVMVQTGLLPDLSLIHI